MLSCRGMKVCTSEHGVIPNTRVVSGHTEHAGSWTELCWIQVDGPRVLFKCSGFKSI